MAAYAALVSLMDLLQTIKKSPDPPLSLDQGQAKSLTEKVSFLQGFLEDFHSRQEIQALARRMADVAHAAEDLIESQILIASEDLVRNEAHSSDFYEGLQRVIQEMELIEKEAMDTTAKKKKPRADDDYQLPPRRGSSLPHPHLGSSIEATAAAAMVGFDDISIQIMDRLTRNQSRRDIVPIVGMGGAGKTTLARNIYEKKLIADHFHLRSWATISQECDVREVLIEILLRQRNHGSREALNRKSEGDLGIQLYQSLIGRRYLIVMDDVWSIDVWDKVRSFFPENNNGSRIMITTRLSKLACEFAGSHSHVVRLTLLDEDRSWELLCKKVFADKSCPLDLEEVGRTIARNCRGLPLSIVTIGGLLAKSGMTKDYWEYVAENLSSLVNSEDDEHCLRTLSLSYTHLPVHLKPCFLYMGLFPEDQRIRSSHLIRLWVAEGFLKPISGKFLEEVGEDYLNDLIERSLVLADERGTRGKVKYCAVHDLLRDLCIRESQKERFFSVLTTDNLRSDGIGKAQRRIATHNEEEDMPHHITPYSAPSLRSWIYGSSKSCLLISLRSARLLRIFAGVKPGTFVIIFDDTVQLVNLRSLCLNSNATDTSFLRSISWNLQTLILNGGSKTTLDIWKMPHLRHVDIYYIDIPEGGQLLFLENLQSLRTVQNFKLSEEVVETIPNIKKLCVYYSLEDEGSMDDYCLNNLGRLKNLEYLSIQFYTRASRGNWLDGIKLLCSLKKLSLLGVEWDEALSTAVGVSLPLLEVLRLIKVAFVGDEWNPVEGQFRRLKYLKLMYCDNLKRWNADSAHFPRLEHLAIVEGSSLEELPSGIGDIPSLQLISLTDLRVSVVVSAKRMLEEQEEEYGNVTLVVRVFADEDDEELLGSLVSSNFKIEFRPYDD